MQVPDRVIDILHYGRRPPRGLISDAALTFGFSNSPALHVISIDEMRVREVTLSGRRFDATRLKTEYADALA